MTAQALLEVRGLSKIYPPREGLFAKGGVSVRAVDQVSFSIAPGETLGLVGESGCGKTTTGRMIMRLIEPSAGEIRFRANGHDTDLLQLSGAALRAFRRHFQMVFQDPYSSLDPRMTVLDLIAEPLRAQRAGNRAAVETRVRELADAVGLDKGSLQRYPHAFSGGQRQRIGIARALALSPKLLVCDEPVSALDVSVQAQIINLLKELQERLGVAYLFIAHDLAVVYHISHRIAVMYAGRIVETAPGETLFRRPRHPYTRMLLAAVPQHAPGKQPVAREEHVSLSEPPAGGCAFYPRCPRAQAQCASDTPPLLGDTPDTAVACHFPEMA